MKNKERIQKFKETGLKKAYQIKLDKILRYKAFNIAKKTKHDGYQGRPASMVYKVFDKKSPVSVIKNKNISKQELVVCVSKHA